MLLCTHNTVARLRLSETELWQSDPLKSLKFHNLGRWLSSAFKIYYLCPIWRCTLFCFTNVTVSIPWYSAHYVLFHSCYFLGHIHFIVYDSHWLMSVLYVSHWLVSAWAVLIGGWLYRAHCTVLIGWCLYCARFLLVDVCTVHGSYWWMAVPCTLNSSYWLMSV